MGIVSLLQVHDEFSELVKKLALKRLSKIVADHLFRGTILNGEFIVVDSVSDKIESAVEMFGSFAARFATILFQENGALVILIEYSVLMAISLCF